MSTISKYFYLTLCIFILINSNILKADCVVFIKPDSADWTMEEYQDRITDNVWITRKNNQSIFILDIQGG